MHALSFCLSPPPPSGREAGHQGRPHFPPVQEVRQGGRPCCGCGIAGTQGGVGQSCGHAVGGAVQFCEGCLPLPPAKDRLNIDTVSDTDL